MEKLSSKSFADVLATSKQALGLYSDNLACLALEVAISNGTTLYSNDSYHFNNFQNKSFSTLDESEIQKQIEAAGGKLISAGKYPHFMGETRIFLFEDGFAKLELSKSLRVSALYYSVANKEVADALNKIFATFKEEEPEGKVYALIPSQSGLRTRSLGVGALPLIRDNYRPEVLKGVDNVIKDLGSEDPLGRLVIIDGPPGTGKTYLIRSLLGALPKVKFLILPSNMASSLGGPEILQALIDNSEADEDPDSKPVSIADFNDSQEKKKQPLVLIIEDADSCLSSRASDNISSISAILNLSDGIIGNLLDLRIVCTTNIDLQDIDSALLRKGRLSARIEVGLLDVEQAKLVYKNAGGTKDLQWNAENYSLAEIYALAKGDEEAVEIETKKKNKVGF
jgi:energy-coupling factor transporter ATP-binding protein EcfA2